MKQPDPCSVCAARTAPFGFTIGRATKQYCREHRADGERRFNAARAMPISSAPVPEQQGRLL